MVTCPLCVHGEQDAVTVMLERVGVTGPALVAVHEILAPCRPDEPCVVRIQEAVQDAAAKIAGAVSSNDGAAAALAALLAALEGLGDGPLDVVAAEMCDVCAGRCHRQGPGGKMWDKAMLRVRDQLIGTGQCLVIEAAVGRTGPELFVGRCDAAQGQERIERAAALTLTPALARRLGNVADRLLRLAQLAIVKKVGPNVAAAGQSKNPLKIRGLRVRGDTQAWSAFHNALLAVEA